MILGPLITENPFAVPGLFWCETGFVVEDVQHLDVAGVQVALPDDLTTAVPKRRSEFLAGRLCAAVALRGAGLPEHVGRNGRAPIWPVGGVGSITHSRSRAIAAVSRSLSGLGLDCEDLIPDQRATGLYPAIMTETEVALRPDGMAFGTYLTLVFSAKEALYKALSAQLARVPEFLDVTVLRFGPDTLSLELHGEIRQAHYRLTTKDCLTLVSV